MCFCILSLPKKYRRIPKSSLNQVDSDRGKTVGVKNHGDAAQDYSGQGDSAEEEEGKVSKEEEE